MKHVEKLPLSPEQYEELLAVRFIDITKSSFKPSTWFPFSVTPEYTIYISNHSHQFHLDKYGVDPDAALVEGSLMIEADGKFEVIFKDDYYQPVQGSKGTPEELLNFKEAVRRKLLSQVQI